MKSKHAPMLSGGSFAGLMSSGKAGGIPLASLPRKKQRQIHCRNVREYGPEMASKPASNGQRERERRLKQMAKAGSKALP